MFYLLTSEKDSPRFCQVLIDTSKIVTIRLVRDEDDYLLAVEDVNDNGHVAVYSSEETLREGLADLLVCMGADNLEIAKTMKIRERKSKAREEITEKLSELLKSLKS